MDFVDGIAQQGRVRIDVAAPREADQKQTVNRLTLSELAGHWVTTVSGKEEIVTISEDGRVARGGVRWSQYDLAIDDAGVLCSAGWEVIASKSSLTRIVGYFNDRPVAFERLQQWKTFVVLLAAAADETGLRLTCSSISGKRLASLASAEGLTWIEARRQMAKQLQPYLTLKLKFVLPSGALLTRSEDEMCIADIFKVSTKKQL
mmetsp:Transcript_56340/g.113019  ORF Transcript_56340/g.113019 Transcript_56340/m.113019 type:complete len:204 (+) Transcript_56340:121-732(+)